ncbi:class I adenylate-forming enzyme family protein [Gordonia shandongensis]|uniref:class I adenylate-forming enzyme family protein n=1 Tax=Gordonia shandongensis TaxID=376351 RepID=UPI00041FA60C|nr:class I adenylate-forming enzyme family protein [Gordonia shandongensis]
MSDVVEVPRDRNPFTRDGVLRDAVGAPYYTDLPDTLLAQLRAWVDATPDAEALVELGGPRFTYAQLWDRATRVAGGLREAGVTDGDRVANRHPAGANWVLAFWGAVMAGGIVVAVNTRSSPSEVEFVLSDAGVRVDLAADTPLPDGSPYVTDRPTPHSVAAFFYTSGTTGSPKGVPTSHRAFLTNAENMVRTTGIDHDARSAMRTLISVPLFHVTGCNSQLLVALRVGGTAVIMPTLDLPGLIDALAVERISLMVTVPAVYNLLLRRPEFRAADVSSVQRVGYGGAPIAPTLVTALQEAFPGATVFNGYGLTESASLLTVLPDQDAVEHADSVGYAVPSVDLGVVPRDPADPSTGELVARGANLTREYWNRPDATAAAIDADGWLHTGDVVTVDDAGRVVIVDRIKDIINRGGENVSSIEVESALVGAPGVVDAAVIAVPDDVMGEKVGAIVYGESAPDLDAVLAHCRAVLADFKVPQYVIVATEPLPRNPGGKLLKARLRDTVTWGDPVR